MNRFRPNVVVDGTAAWAEDDWSRIAIGEVTFRVAKMCGRCVVTTTDQGTAERGKEPLRTLARHRRFGDQLVFGQNLVPGVAGHGPDRRRGHGPRMTRRPRPWEPRAGNTVVGARSLRVGDRRESSRVG